MMKRFFRVLVSMLVAITLLMVSHPPLAVTQGGELTVIIDEIDTSLYENERMLRAYVTVRHPQIGAVEDVAPEEFTLRISDGALFTPDTAEMVSAEVSIAIVLELYDTMRRDDGFENAKAAIRNICLNQKDVADRVAVFGVRQGVDPDSQELDTEYEHPFTTDGGAVANFVQDLQMVSTRPGTPLYDTIIKAMHYTVRVSEEPVGRRGIIVITDGGDRESRNTSDVVVEAARNLRIPIYTIGYTGGARDYDLFLNELANRSGGSYRNTPDSEDFETFLGDMREDLTKRYVLTFPVDDFDTSRHILSVRVNHKNMIGVTDREFDVDIPPTPTPTLTPTPDVEISDSENDEWWEDVRELVEDNLVYIAIGGGLLLLMLVVLIVLLRGKKKPPSEQGQNFEPYAPPDAGWDSPGAETWGPDAGGSTSADVGSPAAPTEIGAGGAWGEQDAWGEPDAFTPYQQETELEPHAGGFSDVPPAAPPAAPPAPPGPAESSTVILERAPKMEHEAMLINRQAKRTYDLSKPEMRLGRASENEICLDSEKVSRRHALIKLEGATFYIQDLGSANGTFVNGNRVQDRTPLNNGDEVRIGNQTFLFNQIS